MLIRTHRRPDSWIDDAAQGTVPDYSLPRGRAASKALKGGNATTGSNG
jgi:histone H1/5